MWGRFGRFVSCLAQMARMKMLLLVAVLMATSSMSTGMSCYVTDSGASMLGMDHALGAESPKLRTPVQQVLQEMADVKVHRAASDVADESALDPISVPVRFELRGMKDVEDVTIVGSWTNWSEHFKLLKKDADFAGWVDVPVGVHQFKFITDGEHWCTSSLAHEDDHSHTCIHLLTCSRAINVQAHSRCLHLHESSMARIITAQAERCSVSSGLTDLRAHA